MSDTTRTEIESIKAELNQRLHERTQAHLKSYRELKDQNIDLVKESQRLRDALDKVIKWGTGDMERFSRVFFQRILIPEIESVLASPLSEPLSETEQLAEPVSNADELRCESVFMAEARSFAAQCWCHDSTKDIPMDTRLAEVMASSIAHWMDTAARHCRNEDYYRSLLHKCGEIIGEDSYICDDGSVSQDVLCAKVPELVKSIVQTHIPRADIEPLVRALENFISVGMEFYDMECGESGGAAINQAEQALATFTAKHGGEV